MWLWATALRVGPLALLGVRGGLWRPSSPPPRRYFPIPQLFRRIAVPRAKTVAPRHDRDRDASPLRQPFNAIPAADLAPDDHEAHLAHLRAARLDPARFAPLYRRYVADVFWFCYRRLDHREDAADATSRTFANALASLGSFRPDPANPGATFRAWLFRIAGNVVIDMQRRRRTQHPIEDAALRLIHPGPTPEEHALASDDARRLHDLLARLPERQRRIVELRLADLSGAEIAEATGMSLSAVKSAQFRAFQTLRVLMQEAETR